MAKKIKIVNRSRLADIVNSLKKERKKIVFTNGCFDVLHRGHVELFEKAKSFGDVLIVGVNSDESVKQIKGAGRPLNTYEDRARVLAALTVVDFVTSFSEPDPENIIKELKPDVLVKGGDWKPENVIGGDTVKSTGGRVEIVPLVKGHSTTSLLRKCRGK